MGGTLVACAHALLQPADRGPPESVRRPEVQASLVRQSAPQYAFTDRKPLRGSCEEGGEEGSGSADATLWGRTALADGYHLRPGRGLAQSVGAGKNRGLVCTG
jgi:hypothetical protein